MAEGGGRTEPSPLGLEAASGCGGEQAGGAGRVGGKGSRAGHTLIC